MSDEPQQPAAEWLTYAQAAARLGLRTPTAAAARARRGRWPKRIRNTDNAAEVLVPGELLGTATEKPVQPRQSPAPVPEAPTGADAVRAAVAPLQAVLEAQAAELQAARTTLDTTRGALADAQAQAAAANARADTLTSEAQNLRAQIDREVIDRRTLQGQADALRDQLASAQLKTAQATGAANTERAKREAIEQALRDTQQRLADAERRGLHRPWWRRLI